MAFWQLPEKEEEDSVWSTLADEDRESSGLMTEDESKHAQNAPPLPDELTCEVVKKIADMWSTEQHWQVDVGSTQLLTDVQEHNITKALPLSRDAYGYHYFTTTEFAFEISVRLGVMGVLRDIYALSQNEFLMQYLGESSPETTCLRRLRLVITPGRTYWPECDGETGVYYLIELDDEKNWQVKMRYDVAWAGQLPWTVRNEIKKHIEGFLEEHSSSIGQANEYGLKFEAFEKLVWSIIDQVPNADDNPREHFGRNDFNQKLTLWTQHEDLLALGTDESS